MNADAPRALWVSTDLETRGGVASCVRSMAGTPLHTIWSVTHIATHRDGSTAAKVWVFTRAAARFVRALGRRPDIVHLHSASYGSFVRKALLGWIAFATRTPVILHVHGGEFRRFHDRSPRLVQWWIRSTLTRSDVVIALGRRWEKRLQEIAPMARIVVVPNAVRVVGPAEQPVRGEPVRVVFVGDVTERKGAFTLLDAWAKASAGQSGAWAHLIIAGSGEVERARSRVAELGIEDHVTVTGWIDAAAVARMLRSAQVLTLPSRAEGQPMVVLEAMANGLCVVASEVGGIPDLIDSTCGVLVPADDPDALAIALSRVVDEQGLRVGLGAAALERVRREFDLETVWQRVDSLYREVVR